MHIEGSGISCGVRRLVITDSDEPSKKQLSELLQSNKNSCAMVVTGIPARRKDISLLLLDSGFERVKDKHKFIADPSVNKNFAELAFAVVYHDHEYVFDGATPEELFEQYIDATVNDKLTTIATSVMHHGNFVSRINFYVCCMSDLKKIIV